MSWVSEIEYDLITQWYIVRLNGEIVGYAKNYSAADDYLAEVITRELNIAL